MDDAELVSDLGFLVREIADEVNMPYKRLWKFMARSTMSSEALQLLAYTRSALRTKGLELKWLWTHVHLTKDVYPAEE
ncbi:hypothetical protein OUZ56_029988 [Daphnia magna]|uniref:Uncharacterized protein n=1 Tax=Daphnia magna TaxID=35525 RepID=A0ABR0B8D8_9CRUS|nr:hypothetical protein OUZ56_029988 [Daphnia magna]